MLESIRKGQRWLTLLLVTFVGAVFVFFMGVGGQFGPAGPTGNAVIELDDIRLQVADYQRLRARLEQFYSEQLGEQFDSRAQSDALDDLTLRQLVDQVVLAWSARELGLRVGREEVQELVRQTPDFRDEAGRFDKQRFVDFANWEYGSQRAFVDSMQLDLLRQKMVSLIYDQATVSPAEARDAALYGLEQVRLAYVALDTANLPAGERAEGVDDETVTAWLEGHREQLEEQYQAGIAAYTVPARAKARHVLVQVDRDADPDLIDAARQKAEGARSRIASGEAFEDVAAALSDDPGSKDQGGDLGEFARGTHAQALEDAAFSLQPGDLSEVVQSDAGFHVVRLDEYVPEVVRSFDEVGPELARADVLTKRAEERAQQLSIQLADAVRGGQSLEDAARELELTLERTPLLTRRPDGFVPGLGGAPAVRRAAFGLARAPASSPTVHPVGKRLVLVQLLEHHMPDAAELDSTVADLQQNLLAAKRNRMVQDWIEQRRDELEQRGQLLVNASLVISRG